MIYNKRIELDLGNLNRKLPTLQARAGCDFSVMMSGAADDCAEVAVRIIDKGGGFYDFPASVTTNGEWRCRILGAAFRQVGLLTYEVRGKLPDGADVALGGGIVLVGPWSAGEITPLDSRRRYVMTIADENGGKHAIYAVKDSAGEWTWQIAANPADEAIPRVDLSAITDTNGKLRVVGEIQNGDGEGTLGIGQGDEGND